MQESTGIKFNSDYCCVGQQSVRGGRIDRGYIEKEPYLTLEEMN